MTGVQTCALPICAFLVLSWLLMFSYLSFARDLGYIAIGSFELPVLNLIQYVPFFIVLIIELNMQQKKKLTYVW